VPDDAVKLTFSWCVLLVLGIVVIVRCWNRKLFSQCPRLRNYFFSSVPWAVIRVFNHICYFSVAYGEIFGLLSLNTEVLNTVNTVCLLWHGTTENKILLYSDLYHNNLNYVVQVALFLVICFKALHVHYLVGMS